ncbi:RepB family plasmid replication initiator protein [Staphylococcus warneri]|uniref:replication initiation protein n=1 Tax=Staphylococcus warneri TaxID=1292 RepID=UPI00214C46A6|nr:RepB family plasmid replication initiator protein [Staphylococcus warneri]MCR1798265.1 RepB family plasmid replication initiator protein [Staphylococcus warneri]
MNGETVVYRNEMNLVPLRKFTSTEIDIFFTLCNKLKEQDTKKLTIPFEELRHLSNYYHRSKVRFIRDLEHVYDKMLSLTYTERSGLSFKKFVLFTGYEVDVNNQVLTVSINPELKHVLNEITGDFTKFELQEMTQLKSTYSKNMFKLLKQYKHTGYFKIQIDDFRERLDVPKSYRMSDLNKNIFKPILKELGFVFRNLHINKIKGKNNRKIEWLEFIFEKENRINSKKDYQLNQENKSSKPASKRNKKAFNREKTPLWLNNDEYMKQIKEEIEKDEQDIEFQKKRQAFLDSRELLNT